jgi:zinc protease
MNAKKLPALLAAGLVVLAASVFAQKDPGSLKFPDLEFKPEKPGHVRIKTGIDFYFKENHEQPSMTALILVKSGSLFDPKDKTGLASLTFQLMKSGGTKSLPPEKIEDRLDFLGSTLSGTAGGEFSGLNLWTLTKNFDESWKLLTDVLMNPAFDKERLETEKKKELEGIRRRWDYPTSVAFNLFQDLIYGKDYPDIQRTTAKGIESITREDIQAFYDQNIRGKELIVAFAGDFAAAKMADVIKKTFRDWPGQPAAKPPLQKATLAAKPGLYVIDKPDMTQAIICLGHLGINRLDPDNVEINLLNFIYGTGSFNSRLMREVRSNRGLAYATFGAVEGGRDRGVFMSFCMTKTQSAAEAIKLIRNIAADMTAKPVSAEELETARRYEQNAFVHKFDSPMSVLQQEIYNRLMGYPENYLTTYIPRIKRVDAPKVLAMAKRTIHPGELVILVVGKKSDLVDQLKALNLGEISELPLPKE